MITAFIALHDEFFKMVDLFSLSSLCRSIDGIAELFIAWSIVSVVIAAFSSWDTILAAAPEWSRYVGVCVIG